MFARSFRSSKTFTTFVVSVAIFTDVLLQNLVAPVLPYALHTQIGLQVEADIQRWTSILLSSYGAAFMLGSSIVPAWKFISRWVQDCGHEETFLTHCLLVLFGHIGDMISSRRIPFVLGLVLVFLSTLAFALATNLWTLLVARILEGLSSAVVSTVGYALLTDVVDREHLGKAMGYTSLALSFGLLIGPVIGGVLYEYCGYFKVYLPAFGLIAMEIILRLMIVEREKPQRPSSSPSPSIAKAAVEDVPPSDAARESEPLLHHSTGNIAQPVLNAYRSLLASPRFLVALAALLVLNGIACGFDSTLSPFIHDSFGMRATYAAALFLALSLPMLLAPLSGWACDRYGPRPPLAAGLVLAALSLALSSLISKDTRSPFAKLVILLLMVGLALASALTPLRVEAGLVVDGMESEKPGCFGHNGANGRAFGLVNMMVAGGGLVGPLYAGFIRVAAGWKVLQCVNGALCVGLLLLVLLVTGGTSR
ncbi:MAG: hypothetical protein Q9173_004319 [Seirophora scorigena]